MRKKSHLIFCLGVVIVLIFMGIARADDSYAAIPASPRATYNFDADWKFIRQEVSGAEAPQFDDTQWAGVSTPHTYNDVDTFNRIISHGSGQQGAYLGIASYRKHFTLPAELTGRKVFIEFEGMRQAGEIFLNGKQVGLYENGVNAYGIDITDSVKFGSDNVLAVRVDNSTNYAEKSSSTVFQWEAKDFNPNYGGINRHVRLHVTAPIHQTLPLYYGLQTTGIYIYPSNISASDGSMDLNVESQVANQSADQASITLSALVVDTDGHAKAKFDGDTLDLVSGEKTPLHLTGHLDHVRLWSPDDPYLYNIYTVLTVENKVVDVVRTQTGFRKTEFRGGAGTGGVFINDKFNYLRGYAQRSSDEWAGLGQAYPDWMHDWTARLIRESHANYIRWMHISPQRTDVESCDRFGIVEVCPAGDKEKDVQGRQWEQRMEVMRNSMIYYRDNPSILFWEAGNNGITADQMKQMVDLKSQWDPNGGRVIGCRTLTDPASTPIAEYFGVMIGQDPRTDALKAKDQMFRAYSAERRDKAPLIETEDFRDEAARRFWDDFSPPHFGFKPGPNDTYHWNSETFSLAAAARYWAYWSNRISNPDPQHSKWSGYASIYFSDSNADGRQDSSEVCRVSGKVDAVRLPKEAYYTYRVMQNDQPDIHIIGHWTYPAGTKKTVYVICNCESVELSINGQKVGMADHPENGYVFAFPGVAWTPGTIKAVGFKSAKPVCEDKIISTGPATAVKLTPITGPGGLRADGADVALFDVEVVDANGHRSPTDEGRIDFAVTGPCVWRGGYNSGIINSTNNLDLNTECGINRVSIRSTRTPGTIRIVATRQGLSPASAEITSVLLKVDAGLAPDEPRRGLATP